MESHGGQELESEWESELGSRFRYHCHYLSLHSRYRHRCHFRYFPDLAWGLELESVLELELLLRVLA
jgi:hypothetical protein